eukprot:TRINITY_DN1430_c0_g1_i1.p2 TRINITY_DN1430_c0_g1~~TRINITY_DN1430_c0_g1_i1.p2  ORF type:complete len:243 (+),score=68.19 TRINITY_DN1430_c0_g1_i1:377-1105(+)
MQMEIAQHFSPKFVMACIFSRKMDLKRVEEMLKSCWKWRVENDYETFPFWSDIPHQMFESGAFFAIPGNRTLDGQAIFYIKPSLWFPKQIDLQMLTDWIAYSNGVGNYFDNMDCHRNGLVMIEDLSGMTMQNVDMKMQKKFNKSLMDNFPFRIKAIYMLHPPAILRGIMAVGKFFMKKKIRDRLHVIEPETLYEIIDPDELHVDFGGNYEISPEECMQLYNEAATRNDIERGYVFDEDVEED